MKDRKFEFVPIGIIHSNQKYRFETPRQGVFSSSEGVLELFSSYAGDAISDLAGFERIWVIYCFHLNQNGGEWKAKVRPPFPVSGRCRSVFATRSPHRVNPIGLSCVELCGVEGNKLFLRHIDMLDGTPVLDVKPYIPEADAFPGALTGWRDEVPEADELLWQIRWEKKFLDQAGFIFEQSGLDLMNFAKVQLGNEPLDTSRKRLKPAGENLWHLGCRTWKIVFSVNMILKEVVVYEVLSNYTGEELHCGSEDKYGDKELHRKFLCSGK